jgi:hypothetical protein
MYRPFKVLTTCHQYPECAVARTVVLVSTMQSLSFWLRRYCPFKCSMFMARCPYAI